MTSLVKKCIYIQNRLSPLELNQHLPVRFPLYSLLVRLYLEPDPVFVGGKTVAIISIQTSCPTLGGGPPHEVLSLVLSQIPPFSWLFLFAKSLWKPFLSLRHAAPKPLNLSCRSPGMYFSLFLGDFVCSLFVPPLQHFPWWVPVGGFPGIFNPLFGGRPQLEHLRPDFFSLTRLSPLLSSPSTISFFLLLGTLSLI